MCTRNPPRTALHLYPHPTGENQSYAHLEAGTSQGTFPMSRDTFNYHNWGDIWHLAGRVQGFHPTCPQRTGSLPTTKNDQAPDVNKLGFWWVAGQSRPQPHNPYPQLYQHFPPTHATQAQRGHGPSLFIHGLVHSSIHPSVQTP